MLAQMLRHKERGRMPALFYLSRDNPFFYGSIDGVHAKEKPSRASQLGEVRRSF
jgi:hypothetical protein